MHLSSDGLLRLSIGELLSLPIQHLMSGVDAETALHRVQLTQACGRPTQISGYTEWVTASVPAVSIGWDWQLQLQPAPQWWSQPLLAQPPFCWARLGPPRTNIMLVYAAGGDTGWHKNLALLGTVVDALPWQDRLQRAVGWPTELA